MGNPVEVHRYSIEKLEQLLAEKSSALPEVIHQKLHSLYFEDYFKVLGAKSIVVENCYIDRDFLEDYAGYYVRCFRDYRRKCTRLHFFRSDFTLADFEQLIGSKLADPQLSSFQKDYLGFVVVKPLPQTIVGRTCLVTYPEANHRFYPITRRYDVSLFGIPLEIKTLAFQEQDRVAAACATSALWSVFHGTGMLFHHPIPSPVEITRAANATLPMEDRSLPSHGLTVMQMAYAIRSVGLEPALIGVRDEYILKAAAYAYLRGRVPALMCVHLFDTTGSAPESRGRHAVAVTGFSIGASQPSPRGQRRSLNPSYAGFLLRASQIDKLYAHDDQVGPFARMEFDGQTVSVPDGGYPSSQASLSTSWGLRQKHKVRACPDVMLVPLYHKIRIPFEVILDLVMRFDGLVETLRQNVTIPLAERPVWDIYLTTVNELKTEISCVSSLDETLCRRVRLAALPRFLWRATAECGKRPVLDLLFDATDIEQGQCLIYAVEYDPALSAFIRQVAKHPDLERLFKTEPENRVLSWFRAQPIP